MVNNTITSKVNEKVKFIKNLNQKKYRYEYNKYYLEGVKVIKEILSKHKTFSEIYYAKEMLMKTSEGKELLDIIQRIPDEKVVCCSESVFCYMVDTITPQGVLMVLDIQKNTLDDLDNTSDILILDRVSDSGNIGTILRSAAAFHCLNILCIEGTADIYAPKVVRSTMATITELTIVFVSNMEIKQIIEQLKQKKYHLIGTSLATNKLLSQATFQDKNAIIVGNEANGCQQELLYDCDTVIKIPMSNQAESLNVACATSILLYKKEERNLVY